MSVRSNGVMPAILPADTDNGRSPADTALWAVAGHGARQGDTMAGTIGDAAAFS
jgi:hypothetical protein